MYHSKQYASKNTAITNNNLNRNVGIQVWCIILHIRRWGWVVCVLIKMMSVMVFWVAILCVVLQMINNDSEEHTTHLHLSSSWRWRWYAVVLNKTALHFILFLTFQNGTGDANDVWKVVIVGGRDEEPVTTVSSKLKFIHYLQHCVLTSSGKQLPKWWIYII